MSENKLQVMPHGESGLSVLPKTQVDMLLETIAPAIQRGTDPAVVREQIALMKDLMAMKAKESFDAAMLVCRKEMSEVFKDSKNESNNSRFATLEKIDRMAYPVYDRNGFTLSWSQAESPQAGWTRLVCDVAHSGGHHELKWLEGPMDDTGMKGSKNKTGIQGMGSTWTYLQRRLLAMCFNIRVVGTDNDGERPKPRGPGETRPAQSQPQPQPAQPPPTGVATRKELITKLWIILLPVRGHFPRGTEPNWNAAEAWLDKNKIIERSESVLEMDAARLAVVIEKAEIQIRIEAGAQ